MNQDERKDAQRGETSKVPTANPSQLKTNYNPDLRPQDDLDKVLNEYLTYVRHDLKSALNSIRESVCLILDGVIDPTEEKGIQLLEIAKRNVDRINDMINDKLSYSKFKSESTKKESNTNNNMPSK